MKVEKDEIIKTIDKNLLSDYLAAGWKIFDDTKKENKVKKIEKKEEEKLEKI